MYRWNIQVQKVKVFFSILFQSPKPKHPNHLDVRISAQFFSQELELINEISWLRQHMTGLILSDTWTFHLW